MLPGQMRGGLDLPDPPFAMLITVERHQIVIENRQVIGCWRAVPANFSRPSGPTPKPRRVADAASMGPAADPRGVCFAGTLSTLGPKSALYTPNPGSGVGEAQHPSSGRVTSPVARQ